MKTVEKRKEQEVAQKRGLRHICKLVATRERERSRSRKVTLRRNR